jgi:hypothetical protein
LALGVIPGDGTEVRRGNTYKQGERRRGEERRGEVRKQTDVPLQLPTPVLHLLSREQTQCMDMEVNDITNQHPSPLW